MEEEEEEEEVVAPNGPTRPQAAQSGQGRIIATFQGPIVATIRAVENCNSPGGHRYNNPGRVQLQRPDGVGQFTLCLRRRPA